jgi:HK97 family phage prohead protease
MNLPTDYPTENLVRGWDQPQTVVTRAVASNPDGAERVLVGEFARFNEWTEIHSVFEGDFLERIAPGAFDLTIERDLSRIKVLYDHGHDPQLGNKPLGPIRSIDPTDTGVSYEVPLIDTDYNRDFIIPAADAELLGASFRMAVRGNEWFDPTEPSDHNPKVLPERTITLIDLFEFGPVTFPAYESASAGLRSRSDEFLGHIVNDAMFLQRYIERTSAQVAAHSLQDAADAGLYHDRSSTHGEHETKQEEGTAHGQPPSKTGRSHQAAAAEILKLRKKHHA